MDGCSYCGVPIGPMGRGSHASSCVGFGSDYWTADHKPRADKWVEYQPGVYRLRSEQWPDQTTIVAKDLDDARFLVASCPPATPKGSA